MKKRIPIIFGFILLLLGVWLQITPNPSFVHFVTRLQNIGYDMQLRARTLTQHAPLATQVAIVDIDDRSITEEGHWPWPRVKLANLVTKLKADGAVVVAFDVLFSESELNIATELHDSLQQKNFPPNLLKQIKKVTPDFNYDLHFAQSLTGIDAVLGVSFLPRAETSGVLSAPIKILNSDEKKYNFIEADGFIGNIPILQQYAKSAGFLNVFPDDDGIIRRVPLLISYQNKIYSSLALEAVKQFLLAKIAINTGKYLQKQKIESIALGNHIIPVDSKSQVIVPFRGPAFTFPYFSAADVLHDRVPVNSLQGKIIFIGTSATGLGDLKATAIQNIFPGVEVQATIAQGILDDNFYERPAWASGAEAFFTFFPGILFVLIFPYLGPRVLSLLALIIPILFILINSWLWSYSNLIISVFMPIIVNLLLITLNLIYGYIFEARKRENLKEIFGQYVPEKHIDEMLTGKDQHSLSGEDREMTVLFADIRSFTTISENLSATELKELLNSFFTPMTEIIFRYNGTIDKYVGDMVMAFWGAPLTDKKHAEHALDAGIAMQKAVKLLHDEFAKKNWPLVNIGIGLNSGVMRVGDMGSRFRRSYTVLGDSVNLASRVESLTKYYGVNFMVGENTQKNQPNFVFRKLDRVRVKGKKVGIEIYEVIGKKAEISLQQQNELDEYEIALANYFEQNWEKSYALFRSLRKKYPETLIYKIYKKRTAAYIKTPPPIDWDGTYIHKSK